MTNTNEEVMRGFAPLGPSGPAGANTSSLFRVTQRSNRIHKGLIRSYGIHAAAILTKMNYWRGKAKELGLKWFFRSAEKLAADIGGVCANTVLGHLRKLESEGVIRSREGRSTRNFNASMECQFNASMEYQFDDSFIRVIGDYHSPFTKGEHLRYGLDDANEYGIGPALLLAHLDWKIENESNEELRECITTSSFVGYFGLEDKDMQNVRNWIKKLVTEGVLLKLEAKRPQHRLRFAEGLDRLPVFDRPIPTIIQTVAEDNTRPGLIQVSSANADVETDGEQPDPQSRVCLLGSVQEPMPLGCWDADFRALVSMNRKGSMGLDDFIVQAVARIVYDLSIEQLVELVADSPDSTISYLNGNGTFDCSRQRALASELLVLALHLRRQPALVCSSVEIRRAAYELALEVQGRLQEVRDRRSQMLGVDDACGNADIEMPDIEKAEMLIQALSFWNQVGIEKPGPPGMNCPNPEVTLDCFDLRGGQCAALGIFGARQVYSVAEILECFMVCATVPPAPIDSREPDPWRYVRRGTRVSYFRSNLTRIINDMA